MSVNALQPWTFTQEALRVERVGGRSKGKGIGKRTLDSGERYWHYVCNNLRDRPTDLESDAYTSPSEQKKRRIVNSHQFLETVPITAVYVSPEDALRSEDNAGLFPFLWPVEDESLIVTLTSIDIADITIPKLAAALTTAMPHSTRTIRAIWGVISEKQEGKGPKKDKVFLLHDDHALQGWIARTKAFPDRTMYVVYYRLPSGKDSKQSDTPISGNRPFFHQDEVLPAPDVVVYDIPESEDDEDAVYKAKPRSLPWSRKNLKKREILVQKRIIRQTRMLQAIRARALGFYANWENTVVGADEVSWLADNKYIKDPPTAGSVPLPKKM